MTENKHSCLDCKYIDIIPSEPLDTRFDCFYPKWEDGHNEYYWNAWEENDCDYFKPKQYRLNKWATKLLKNDRPLFDWVNDSDEIVDLLNEQEETIQRLKKTMKGVAEILSIDADLFSDKATEHDINAYIELKEFDNKDAYCMAVSIKEAIKILRGNVE